MGWADEQPSVETRIVEEGGHDMIEWGSNQRIWRERRRDPSPRSPDNGEKADGNAADSDMSQVELERSDGQVQLPFRDVERDTYDHLQWAFNAALALLAFVLVSPAMLLIALAIKLDSDGPVFYRQLRVGLDRRGRRRDEDGGRRTLDLGGQPFMLYKFRTMTVDAEEETGPVWSSDEDDRVTRVGRFLRRHRLDELPQLWNVVKGEMSIVGPRPERPSLVSYLREEIDGYPLRNKVLPGITGWAQVNRDADQTLDDVRSKLRFDLEYLQQRSVMFDLRIMARTLPVMLERDRVERPEGAGSEGRGNDRHLTQSVRT